MFFGSKKSRKKFSYNPRYYDPERDKNRKRRMRIKSKTHRGKTHSFLWLAIILAIGAYVYSIL